MKARIIVLGWLIFFYSTALGQTKSIKIEVVDFISTKTDISFNLAISNLSDLSITTYLPTKDDICLGMVRFTFVDVKNGRAHNIDTCTTIVDLDKIILSCNNTLFLNPGEKFEQKFNFSKREIFPYLKRRRSYQFVVEWFLKDVYFETSLEKVFQENIQSNKVQF